MPFIRRNPTLSHSSIAVADEHPTIFAEVHGNQSFTILENHFYAAPYATGSLQRYVLEPDTPFPHRTIGGALRFQIYGTSDYGSGFPYGYNISNIAERPFPFAFEPIFWTTDFSSTNSTMAGAASNYTARPGGPLTVALITPRSSNSTTIPDVYRILGDNASVFAVTNALSSKCGVSSPSPLTTWAPSNGSWPLPGQVVQYYRTSSFALSIDSLGDYNSSSASYPSLIIPSSTVPPPSLPSNTNTTLLTCINTTIGASLPLLNPTPLNHDRPDKRWFIVSAAVVAFFVAIMIVDRVLVKRVWPVKKAQKEGVGEGTEKEGREEASSEEMQSGEDAYAEQVKEAEAGEKEKRSAVSGTSSELSNYETAVEELR